MVVAARRGDLADRRARRLHRRGHEACPTASPRRSTWRSPSCRAPGRRNCVPVRKGDPQSPPANFGFTSGSTVVDQNANELWTVLVCKPWLDGELGTTSSPAAERQADGGEHLRPAAAVGPGHRGQRETDGRPHPGQAGDLRRHRARASSRSTRRSTRCSRASSGPPGWRSGSPRCSRRVVAGVLVLLIAVTLILLKLGFLLLLVVGPVLPAHRHASGLRPGGGAALGRDAHRRAAETGGGRAGAERPAVLLLR